MGYNAQTVAEETVRVFKGINVKAKIILGSFRQISHLNRAILTGAHVLTIPPKILREMVNNPKTTETIQEFLDYWEDFKKKSYTHGQK